MIDKFRKMIARWMDNGLVFLVSPIHIVGKSIVQIREKHARQDSIRPASTKFGARIHAPPLQYPPSLITATTGWVNWIL